MKLKTLIMSALLGAASVYGEFSQELGEGLTLRYGGDMRVRYEGYTSGVPRPNADKNHNHDTEYLRVRTRIYGALDIGQDVTVNLRLGNRVHYVTTSPSKHNNDGKSTWEFPDEMYVDAANVVFKNLLDGVLTLTLGRQDLMLGNGLILSEGTPYDQGRSVYHDGAVGKVKYDDSTLTAFVFYDSWKDGCVFVNDQNRRLRSGDLFTAGLYNTLVLSESFAVDSYYMFNDLDDTHPEEAERAHKADASVSLHTVGARLFGTCPAWLDYSLEMARQYGRDSADKHVEATVVDGRLGFHLAEESALKPVWQFEYGHFSGEDVESGKDRGWNPLMSECPLWGEELVPIMLNSVWSNLNMFGTKLTCNVTDKSKVSLYATDYRADESAGVVGGNVCSGGGKHVGTLAGVNATYKFSERLSALVYLSHFMPASYFDNGEDSNWFRLEMTLTL